MPDNPRTLAELDALYSDNNAGAISAQDLRDGFHSVADPISGSGFDTVGVHQAFGDAAIDEGPPGYLGASVVLSIKDTTDAETDYSGEGTDVSVGVASGLVYNRSTPLTGGYYPTEVYGGVVSAEYTAPQAGLTTYMGGLYGYARSNPNAGALGAGARWTGVQGEVASGFPYPSPAPVPDTAVGLSAAVTYTGGGSIAGKAMFGVEVDMHTERAGGSMEGVRIRSHSGAGVPDSEVGLNVQQQQTWNIFSAGAASKNKFEGRLIQGTPNSAPTDADLGNGQISAYLDQSGNKIKWRARYSDGTLKTGEVALA